MDARTRFKFAIDLCRHVEASTGAAFDAEVYYKYVSQSLEMYIACLVLAIKIEDHISVTVEDVTSRLSAYIDPCITLVREAMKLQCQAMLDIPIPLILLTPYRSIEPTYDAVRTLYHDLVGEGECQVLRNMPHTGVTPREWNRPYHFTLDTQEK